MQPLKWHSAVLHNLCVFVSRCAINIYSENITNYNALKKIHASIEVSQTAFSFSHQTSPQVTTGNTTLYEPVETFVKAAIINIFILTIDLMTVCNVRGAACNDEPTEDYHPPAVPLSI